VPGQKPKPAREFVQALGVTLADETLEPGYRAQFILLPSESDLARVIARDVDPLAIQKARNDLRKTIGTMLADALIEAYRKNEVKGTYSPASEPAGRRSLRNTALGYLASRGRAEDVARVVRHFKDADNATDEVGALSILSQLRSPERGKALEHFYERWKDDHLVVDTWFAYQAVSPLASALTSVKKLTRPPAVLDQEPQQGAGPDRHVRARQPRELQPAGRGGLRVRRRPGAGARRLQSADRGAAVVRLPQLESAGAGAAQDGQEGVAARRQGQAAVARRVRDRLEDARVGVATATARRILSAHGIRSRQEIRLCAKLLG
jgi:aminopeptidase N